MPWKVPYSGISNRLGLEEAEALVHVLGQDILMKGPTAQQFEREFAERIGVKHALAMTSCTTALFLAAQILKLQAGDEVITTPQTFWVTTWPMLARKCKIRFADIEPNTLNIDPNTIEPLITEKTKAICVVHFGGQAVEMDAVMALAQKYNLRVIEDCAHTPGACYKNRHVGTFGDVGCFSFQSLKNMTTGEGGMLVTNDDKLYEYAARLGTLHMHGEMMERTDKRIGPYREPEYYRDWHAQNAFNLDYVDGQFEVGNNFRMSDLQAAVGRVQLRKLDQNNDRRRAIAHRLNEGLRAIPGITVQAERPYAPHIYHLYSFFYDPQVVGASKDEFIRHLEQVEGIQIVVRFFPVHLLAEFRALGHQYGECPVAERLYFENQMQLPIYSHLTDEQIDHMIQGVRRAVEKLSA
ncbi:MAG: DegT/DnrJ/EryC1/StrS family aminotransferase [Anaerolineales bacterium]|nr:DegT/DnrJ/EryC1/StrS family aminotransferase [Anaerolineales bacterium]